MNDGASTIVGTWDLVSRTVRDHEGAAIEGMTSLPAGRTCFDAAGNMVAIVLALDANAVGATGASFEGLTCYYGTYLADPETGTLTVTVTGAGTPGATLGRELIRRYDVDAQRLALRASFTSGEQALEAELVWRRVG